MNTTCCHTGSLRTSPCFAPSPCINLDTSIPTLGLSCSIPTWTPWLQTLRSAAISPCAWMKGLMQICFFSLPALVLSQWLQRMPLLNN